MDYDHLIKQGPIELIINFEDWRWELISNFARDVHKNDNKMFNIELILHNSFIQLKNQAFATLVAYLRLYLL